jgi:hypothetical protein
MTRRLTLPVPWFYGFPELAHEWGCTVDRIYYYADAGLLKVSVLIPRSKLKGMAPAGPSPHVCLLLGDVYRELAWRHTAKGSRAELGGEFTAFAVDQQWFATFNLNLVKPITISRADLVVILEHREYLEQVESFGSAGLNPVERRTLLTIIGGLVRADRLLAKQGRYSVAKVVAAALDGAGASLSEETIATKVGEATALIAAKGSPTLDSLSDFGITDETGWVD